MAEYITKDSGRRQDYDSGMRRDIQDGKPRVDLLLADGVPYEEQLLVRAGALMERGATKYGERNWEKANSTEELARFKASALRHLLQWYCGETDEDHATAVIFNLIAYESTLWKVQDQERRDNPVIEITLNDYTKTWTEKELEEVSQHFLQNLERNARRVSYIR